METAFQSDGIDLPWICKDPGAVLDYEIDWSDWLPPGDVIASVVWSVPAGINQANATHTASTTTIWLSGDTVGIRYTIKGKITTIGGRTDERSFVVISKNR